MFSFEEHPTKKIENIWLKDNHKSGIANRDDLSIREHWTLTLEQIITLFLIIIY